MELHEYQKNARDFLLKIERGALFVDMGLGKTLISLAAFQRLLETQPGLKALVVAPKAAAVSTWPGEWKKWRELLPLVDPPLVLAGGRDARRRAGKIASNLHVINRETLPQLIDESAGFVDYDVLIIDELTSFKNSSSQRFKVLRKALGEKRRPRWVWGLTATPSANRLEDVWAQVFLIDNGKSLGGSYGKFLTRFFLPDKRDWKTGRVFSWIPLAGAVEEISRRIAPIVFRLKAEDYLTMPRLVESARFLRTSPGVLRDYQRFVRDRVIAFHESGEPVTAVTAATLAGKLQQMASGCVYGSETGKQQEVHRVKVDYLVEKAESLAAAGENLLVAYKFRADKDRLLRSLPGAREIRTVESIEAWQRGEISVGVFQPQSVGHGVNLQAGGRHLVFFTPDWDVELRSQTVGRVFRQGQSRPVIVESLALAETIDEDILAVVDGRGILQETVLKLLGKESVCD